MYTKLTLLICLAATLWQPISVDARRGDIFTIIEGFMTKQFPEAKSHFWVVNATQWQADDEIVVDLNTVVVGKVGQAPTENRFLLLIVGDRLAAAQNIPMDAAVECNPERA